LLDDQQGGTFQVCPPAEHQAKQTYWPETNVLVTRFLTEEGVAELIDYMPAPNGEAHHSQLIRSLRCVRGRITLRMRCLPAFNYARDPHKLALDGYQATFSHADLVLQLNATFPLTAEGQGVSGSLEMEEGDEAALMLHARPPGQSLPEWDCTVTAANSRFRETIDFWRRWVAQATYTGRWRETVLRSALTLKLLTFQPTGAIVASPTCSLPENLGGERNWDYRYTWIRDAAFTIYAFMRIGFTEEAGQFMQWVEARCADLNPDGSLQIMYGLDGRKVLTEEHLDHLDGYQGSRPVRIGNRAYQQLQLDIYGELMDAVYLYNKYGSPISYQFWTHLRKLVDWVCENWQRTDEGIWEVRSGQQHFVYSKLMCWVAVDRAIRLADKRSFPADRLRWSKIRDEIYEEIM
jgi:GH15 family glucan-1,4-alpha-glucosidase